MQQAYNTPYKGYNQQYRGPRRGQKRRAWPQQAPFPYFIPLQVPQPPYYGTSEAEANRQQRMNSEAIHPPEYKALYKLWNRMQAGASASEKRDVFQLCEQAHNFKVENKISNLLIVLQNTFVQLMQQVANKQMEVDDNLGENNAIVQATPPLPNEEADQVVQQASQQNPIQQENMGNQMQENGEMAANAQQADQQVMQQTEIQQQIDEFGLHQQQVAQELKQQINTTNRPMTKQRSVIEQLALMGSRSGTLNRSNIGSEVRKAPQKPLAQKKTRVNQTGKKINPPRESEHSVEENPSSPKRKGNGKKVPTNNPTA